MNDENIHRPGDEPARTTTAVWGDTVRPDRCKSPRCRRPVWWAQNVRSGRWMIFDGDPRYLFTSEETETGRTLWTVDLALTHWGTCVDADRFRSKTARSSR